MYAHALLMDGVDIAEEAAMYFERWGLLAPPSGKARSEGYMSLLSHTSTIPQRCVACNMAYGRAGVQETATYLLCQSCLVNVLQMAWKKPLVLGMLTVGSRFVSFMRIVLQAL
jgi:hypothetical protein